LYQCYFFQAFCCPGKYFVFKALCIYFKKINAVKLLLIRKPIDRFYIDVFLADHLNVPAERATTYGTIAEALVSLGFLAGRTRRLELGVSALVVPQRQPLVALKQLTTLDFLSGGRIVTAVSPGWMEGEFASLGPNIVANASPCVERSESHLALYGVMKFSRAFLPQIISRGQLNDVVLHEMTHVLGFNATLFSRLPDTTDAKQLIVGAGTSTSGFRGVRAITACLALPLAVTGSCSPLVPLENTGGVGSVDSHWRESVFRSELMTSTIANAGVRMPFSALSIAALADLGYTTDPSVADAYTFGAASIAEPGSATAEPGSGVLRFDDVVQSAVAVMSPDGRFARLRPRRPRPAAAPTPAPAPASMRLRASRQSGR